MVDEINFADYIKKSFKEGKGVGDIAFSLGLSSVSKGGLVKFPKGTTAHIRNVLGFSTWKEYHKKHNSIVTIRNNKLRREAGFTTKLKKRIKDRDGGCVVCRKTSRVHVHHIDGDYTNNDEKNLITVCPNLHGIIDTNSKRLSVEKLQLKRDYNIVVRARSLHG